MGWKGTLREIQAAQRRSQREAQRRQRLLEQQRRELEKMQELERASYEVAVFDNEIDLLLSVHREASEEIDWHWMAAAPEPPHPVLSDTNEAAARTALESYVPTRTDRLTKRTGKKEAALREAVEAAVEVDQQAYRQARSDYADWQTSTALASRVLHKDLDAYREAIDTLGPFDDIAALGSSIDFKVLTPDLVEATVHVRSESVVPSESKSLLKSGKLSVKAMPKGRFYEIYQDYVAGCVLRVGRELFSNLPINAAIVTAVDSLLNSATGHMEEQPILSVAIPKSALDSLNLNAIDPSDSLTNFVHNMSFKKTQGFSAVEAVDPSNLENWLT